MAVNQNGTKLFMFDFDGVIRLWLEERTAIIEQKHGIDIGSINTAAFADDLLFTVTTGKLKWSEWIAEVGEKIQNPQAAIEWANRPTVVDNEVIAVIRKLRCTGFEIGLLTNGTDNLHNELYNLGLDKEFNYVFNSAEIGFAKPSPVIYQTVLNRCNLRAENVAFVDDRRENVLAANRLGIKSLHYEGLNTLIEWLRNEFSIIHINRPG